MKMIPFLLEFIGSLQIQGDIWISTPTITQLMAQKCDRASRLYSDKSQLGNEKFSYMKQFRENNSPASFQRKALRL